MEAEENGKWPKSINHVKYALGSLDSTSNFLYKLTDNHIERSESPKRGPASQNQTLKIQKDCFI